MPLPTDNLTTLHLDAATDDPSQARVELLNAVNKIKELIAAISAVPGVDKILASDANGNIRLGRVVGINTVPDADHDATLVTAAQEVGEFALLQSRSNGGLDFAQNAKLVGGVWVYRNTGATNLLQMDSSGTTVYAAPSGTAGAAIPWTAKLTIPNAAGSAIMYEGADMWSSRDKFYGRVHQSGSALRLPNGWSVIKGSAGLFNIVHNLSSAGYSIVATTFNASVSTIIRVGNQATMSFDIRITDHAGTPIDDTFSFILMRD